MALLPIITDKTDRDFESLRLRLRNLIGSVFPRWTDDSKANFGNILTEEFAHVGDINGYYDDRNLRESRWPTATLRRSVLSHCKLINYRPKGANASQVDVTLTLGVAAAGIVTVAKGDTVRTKQVTAPIIYQILADVVFDVGETTKTVTVENSVFQSESFLSTGLPNQRFKLTKSPYLDGSLTIDATDGTYVEVETFLDSKSTDRHFTTLIDANGKCTVIFGNGINGSVPQGALAAGYKTGGGADGVVEPGSLTVVVNSYNDSLGNGVSITCTNTERSSAAHDRESLFSIKQNGPRSIPLMKRAVSRPDFEVAAVTIPGVARALHLTSNELGSVPENTGFLFLVPTGGGAASIDMRAAVAALFEAGGKYPKLNTYALIVKVAVYVATDVYALVYRRAGVPRATAKAEVTDRLTKFFAIDVKASDLLRDDPDLAKEVGVTAADGDSVIPNPRVNFGFYAQTADGEPTGQLAYSDVFNVVRDSSSIRKIGAGASEFLLNGKRADLVIGNFAFPTLGTITLVDGDDGQPL